MLGLDPNLVAHALNVEPRAKPVVQPMRTFHLDIEAQIIQEVQKLLIASFIKPIIAPSGISSRWPVLTTRPWNPRFFCHETSGFNGSRSYQEESLTTL